jgi:hypothetical protein
VDHQPDSGETSLTAVIDLAYKGKKLANWWVFIGDFDFAMQRGMKLDGK